MDEMPGETLLYEKDAFVIRGAIFDVYRAMGAGFLEAVYRECLEIELERRDIPFRDAETVGAHLSRQAASPDLHR